MAQNRCRCLPGILIVIALLGLVLACRPSRPTPVIPPPAVVITSPLSEQSFPHGSDVVIHSTANDTQGIVRVELWVDAALYRVDASPDPDGQTTFVVSQPWYAASPGSHQVVVRAYSKNGLMAESMPLTIQISAQAAVLPSATPTVAPTETALPATDTPITPSSTPTFAAPPTPTLTPTPPAVGPTATPLPSETPGSTPTPTLAFGVPEPFLQVWLDSGGVGGRLGQPLSEAVLDRWAADQAFEAGLAFWRNNESAAPNEIYVLFYADTSDTAQGVTWSRYQDLWQEGMPQYACPAAEVNGELGPVRGFGKIWCEQPAVQTGLGQPLVREQGAVAGFQDFEGGALIWLGRLGYIYVLYANGEWIRAGG
ncbi:MAG: Ig-like domain-containing protein [Chloroflexota bacterium]